MPLPLRVVDPERRTPSRKRTKQWKWVWPYPAEIEPQQQDKLPEALSFLEPFSNEKDSDAQNASSECPTRELAIKMIGETARRFNEALYLADSAPRFKHMIEELDELQAVSERLTEVLKGLNDFTRHGLRSAGPPTEERVE